MSDYTIETRRRSRSKTPFLRSSCDHENCEHIGDEPHVHHSKKKSTPSIKTIAEENVEVTSSSSVGTGKDSPSKMAQTKIKTSDYFSEDSPENKNKIFTRIFTSPTISHLQQHKQTETRTSSTVVTRAKIIGDDSLTTSTPKATNYATSYAAQFVSRGEGGNKSINVNVSGNEGHYQRREYKEYTQNVLNAEKEQSSSKSKFFGGFLGKSFGEKSLNSDASDHIAYMEYKKAGEYWKTTPKTDYTYSELSPHRRELAPGIVAMPNMSRLSLENHHQRVNYMIQRNPAHEEHIRQRYESPKYNQRRTSLDSLIYDSGDEAIDYAIHGKNRNFYNYNAGHKERKPWLVRLIIIIVTTITTAWSTVSDSSNRGVGRYIYNNSSYHTKLAEERGFFGSIILAILSAFLSIVRNIYLFISYVLCLDTWLLRSSNPESKNKKRFLLFLLILLPLLLLAGVYYYIYPTETFPPKSFSQYNLVLPEIPKVDISEYINEETYYHFKSRAQNHFDDVLNWSNDYLLYLRTVTQNLVDEGRKIFQREEYYERI